MPSKLTYVADLSRRTQEKRAREAMWITCSGAEPFKRPSTLKDQETTEQKGKEKDTCCVEGDDDD